MTVKMRTLIDTKGEEGGFIELAVGSDNRLYLNGEPIATEGKLNIQWWVSWSVVAAGLSTLTVAIVEVGRSAGWWM